MASTPPKTSARKGPRAKVGVTAVRAEQRRLEAWRLADEEGMSCPQIAEALGISRQRAWQLLGEELAVRGAEVTQHSMSLRVKNTIRHETQLRALAELRTAAKLVKDLKTQVAIIKEERAIVAEISKLWGAHAPTKAELSGPNGGPLQTQAMPGPDLSQLSDADLAQMQLLLEKVTPAPAPDPLGL